MIFAISVPQNAVNFFSNFVRSPVGEISFKEAYHSYGTIYFAYNSDFKSAITIRNTKNRLYIV